MRWFPYFSKEKTDTYTPIVAPAFTSTKTIQPPKKIFSQNARMRGEHWKFLPVSGLVVGVFLVLIGVPYMFHDSGNDSTQISLIRDEQARIQTISSDQERVLDSSENGHDSSERVFSGGAFERGSESSREPLSVDAESDAKKPSLSIAQGDVSSSSAIEKEQKEFASVGGMNISEDDLDQNNIDQQPKITDTMRYKLSGDSTWVAGEKHIVTIAIVDAQGDRVTYDGDRSVIFTGAYISALSPDSDYGVEPVAYDTQGISRSFGMPTAVHFVEGEAKVDVVLFRAEEISLDVIDYFFPSSLVTDEKSLRAGYNDISNNSAYDLDIRVLPAELSHQNSSITLRNYSEVMQGDAMDIFVETKDTYGNRVFSPDREILIAVSLAHADALSREDGLIMDNGDGTYIARYQPVADGLHSISAQVDGQFVQRDSDGNSDGDLYVAVTREPEAYLEITDAFGYDVIANAENQGFYAGEQQDIFLRVIDRNGNIDVEYDGEKFIVFNGPSIANSGDLPTCRDANGDDISIDGTSPVALTFHRGVAKCTLQLYKQEVFSLNAYDKENLTISTYMSQEHDLDIHVFAASGGDFSVLSVAPNPVVAGSPVTLSTTVFDRYGNQNMQGGDDVKFFLATSSANMHMTIDAILDNEDGTYTSVYYPTLEGVDYIEATVNGVPVLEDTDGESDGTFYVHIRDEVPSRFVIQSPREYIAGQEQEVKIIAQNEFGEQVKSHEGTYPLTFMQQSMLGRDVLIPEVVDARTGDYVPFAAYTNIMFKQGVAEVDLVFYQESEDEAFYIQSGAYMSDKVGGIKVSSGEVDVMESLVTVDATEITLGDKVTVSIALLDSYGNKVVVENTDDIEFRVVSPDKEVSYIRLQHYDEMNYLYSVDFAPDKIGEYIIEALVGKEKIWSIVGYMSDGKIALMVSE